MKVETVPNIVSFPVESLEGLSAKLGQVHTFPCLIPFAEDQRRLAGAEVFTNHDHTIMLVTQYDIRTDTWPWRVRVQLDVEPTP